MSLFDLADLELLAGLVERGFTIVELLRKKSSGPYQQINFRRFVHDDPRLPTTARARRTVARWHDAMDEASRLLGFTDEAIARMRAA